MDDVIHLSNFVLDFNAVAEIYDNEDHVLVVFGANHEPFSVELTDSDATAVRAWLDADWQQQLAELDGQGIVVINQEERRRMKHSDILEPPDIDSPPPF